MKKTLLLLLLLILNLAIFTIAFSPDEVVTFISSSNNYLLPGEQAVILAPQTMITYSNNEYYVVAAQSGNSTTVYFPINNETEEIASGAIKTRELIRTSIIVSKVYDLKNNYPVGDWPYSRSNKTNFDTLATKFNDEIASYTIIESGLEEANEKDLSEEAGEIKNLLKEISIDSLEMSELIQEGINFEKKYFINPDTNQTDKYEKLFENYFESISNYKSNYNLLKSKVNVFRNAIGSATTLEINQREYYTSQAILPKETALLNSVFSRSDETQTFVEEIFNATTNIENFILNLNTRKERNETWQLIYGNDEDIAKLNPGLSSLSQAAETILSEENSPYWKNQDAVSALRTNWKQTQTKYENRIYNSAKEFAKSAKKNVLSILEEKFVEPENEDMGGLLINIIILLIIVIIGIFLFEKFYLNKKNEEGFDEYEEYQ